VKYPRTQHWFGSKGVTDLSEQFDWREAGVEFVVIEEKFDGTGVAIFVDNGRIRITHRGTNVSGEEYSRLLRLVAAYQNEIYSVLTDRYVMFGEYLCAQHTIRYDQLPSFFFETDIYDRERGVFLSTEARHALLDGIVPSVPVLFQGNPEDFGWDGNLVGPSLYSSIDNREGLFVKVELTDGTKGVTERMCKFVDPAFLQRIEASGSHWKHRAFVPNQLRQDG